MSFHVALRKTLAVAVCLGAGCVTAQTGVPSLEACRERIDQNPRNPAVYYCVYRSVLADGHAAEAAAMLRGYSRRYPDVHRIEMFLAWIDRMRGRPGADLLLARSIDGMEATGDDWGVVYGGLDLAGRLGERGNDEAALAQLDRCERAARRTGDRTMMARVLVGRGIRSQRLGDYSDALHLARRARRDVFPDGPYDLRCAVLDLLGAIHWHLCRYGDALEAFERAVAIREVANDRWWEAVSAYDAALCAVQLMHEGRMDHDEGMAVLERARRLTAATGSAAIRSETLVLLGGELGGERGLELVRRGKRIARRENLPALLANALLAEGNLLVEMGRPGAGKRLRDAVVLAREAGVEAVALQGLAAASRAVALDGSREEAVRSYLAVLEAVENARDRQVPGTVRAQSFVRWGFVYYRLAGFLLAGAPAGPLGDGDRAEAFRVMERFRARELLEEIGRPGGGRETDTPGDAGLHTASLRRISLIQRKLTNPGLEPGARERALADLAREEEREAVLKDRLARRRRRVVSGGSVVGVREVQALLGTDEAMLAYQLWDGDPWTRRRVPMGRSWLLVVTRDRVRSVALPSRSVLRARVSILEGAILARDITVSGITARAAARLHADLVAEALRGLPDRIRRLVIVPDDVLFRCPFPVLAASPGARPLGCAYAISTVPSAAVWVHLRRRRLAGRRERGTAALILSDPGAFPDTARDAVLRSGEPWRRGLCLAPLANARREGRALERAAGPGTLLLSGDSASEAAIKALPLERFGVIDLVTHAVVDPEQPERSAIVLAPGSATEDGLLQVREIPWLGLDGQLVVLSSCGSSSGELLGGEGARSLARAFLEGGASAVLASLWPLRDGEAATLFALVSEALGRGEDVAEALRLGRARAVDGGMPEAGWAGISVLGDGSLRPFPRSADVSGAWYAAAILAAAALVTWWLARRRRQSPDQEPPDRSIV